jgi:hypothetical protein
MRILKKSVRKLQFPDYHACITEWTIHEKKIHVESREESFGIGKNNFNGRNIGLARIGVYDLG